MVRLILLCFVLVHHTSLSGQNKDKTFLLVHGAWHGAWCWNKVVPIMTDNGYKVIALDLPSHGNDTTNPNTVTFDDYVNKVTETANKVDGEVILVGHSMGGTVISQSSEVLGKKRYVNSSI